MLVRHELGPEASVLQTREVAGKFFGLLSKPCIEVQASRDAKVMRRLPDVVPLGPPLQADDAAASFDFTEDDSQHKSFELVQLENAEPADASNAAVALGAASKSKHRVAEPQRRAASAQYARFGEHSAARAERIEGVASHAQKTTSINYLSPAMFEVFTEMLDSDVDPDAARVMLQEVAAHCSPEHLNDAWLIKGRLCQLIQQQVNVSGPIELTAGTRQVVALVGPTGVGKTTTLAKLAAGFHFDQGASVGLVTLDTFRLGAVEQLQKYADLLGVPCEVVSAPDQMLPALDRLNHCQLVLIDTAGRSPRDHSQLGALNDFLHVAAPAQIHLVLSAASSQSHAATALEEFATVQPTHLLLTKLDESPCLGSWYRLLASGAWPLSYITTGQQVPEDILVANRRRLASLILGQSNQLTRK